MSPVNYAHRHTVLISSAFILLIFGLAGVYARKAAYAWIFEYGAILLGMCLLIWGLFIWSNLDKEKAALADLKKQSLQVELARQRRIDAQEEFEYRKKIGATTEKINEARNQVYQAFSAYNESGKQLSDMTKQKLDSISGSTFLNLDTSWMMHSSVAYPVTCTGCGVYYVPGAFDFGKCQNCFRPPII